MSDPKTVEIAQDIYWVGGSDQDGGLHCNPYLIVDGDEAVLIDPGSVLDFESVYANVCSIVPLEKIKYVVLHHQDPDLCASVPLFEQKGANFKIVTHWRTQTLVKYYGLKSDYYIVNAHEMRLVLNSGRVLEFIPTPYLHFPGATTTYDVKSKVLFSSDLFGAFSFDWELYAGKNYLEGMKAFHEHYMPSNAILRPVMEVFLGIDISIIAPQHGSVIKNDPVKYIKALRDLECGAFLEPIKKDLSKSGGYKSIYTSVLKRYASVFSKKEVLEILEGLEISIDEDLTVTDYNYTGEVLWDLIFERVLTKKGSQWLEVIEPLVKTLSKEYDIRVPAVYKTNLKNTEKKLSGLNKELQMLREINIKLESDIKETGDKLMKCPVTNLYNSEFFKKFLAKEIGDLSGSEIEQTPCLMLINIDNIEETGNTYGYEEINKTLENFVSALESLPEVNRMLFRLDGAMFALYLPNMPKNDAIQLAENIRNSVSSSARFIEGTSVSIGLAYTDELKSESKFIYEPDEILFSMALARMKKAGQTGGNKVISSSSPDEYKNEKGKVLLIDSDEVFLAVLKSAVENIGYEVISAENGEEALRIVGQRKIVLIISEIMLPQTDGFLIREKLLSDSATKDIPFILVSHLKNENSVIRASNLGIENYFKKPFMLSELTGLIRNKLKGAKRI